MIIKLREVCPEKRVSHVSCVIENALSYAKKWDKVNKMMCKGKKIKLIMFSNATYKSNISDLISRISYHIYLIYKCKISKNYTIIIYY